MITLNESRRNSVIVDILHKFDHRADAEAAMRDYQEVYPPEGYGTILTMRREGNLFVVSGHRQASCD